MGLGLLAGPTIAVVAPATPAVAATTAAFHGSYDRASLTSSGAQLDAAAEYPTLSADGRFVLFASTATNIASGLTGGDYHLYVHDRTTGSTSLVDIGQNGARPDAGLGLYLVEQGSISDDGRYVAFSSRATNLVSGDTNGESDVFVRDRQSGTTTRVSTDAAGGQGSRAAFEPQISADGRYVSFITSSSLDPSDDDGGYGDVYRKDRTTGAVVLASPSPATFRADAARMSGNGRWIAYGGQNTMQRYDIETGTTTPVTGPGGAALDGWSYPGGISDDGTRIVFESGATNIGGPGDTAGVDAFLTDFVAGTTTRYTQAVAGSREAQDTTISRDGTTVAYSVMNAPLVVREIDTGGTVTYQDGWYPDQPWLSADGGTVAFTDLASLASGDTNGLTDVYVTEVSVGPDTTAPRITCAPADGQWHADNVTVGCTASDSGSGLASSGDASFTIATTVPDGTATASAAATPRSVCDVAGNCAQATSTGHKVDRNRPSGLIDPSSQGTFVRDADVTAAFSCIDTGSGIATCEAEAGGAAVLDGDPLPTQTVGTSTIDVTATDGAGNTETASAPFVVTDQTLTGTITSSGSPISDAVVSLWPAGAEDRSAWGTTDGDGSYRFDLADTGTGTFTVQVTKDGYQDAWVGGTHRGNADPIGLGIRPQVADAALTPVPGPDEVAPVAQCQGPAVSSKPFEDDVSVGCLVTDDVALADPADAAFTLATTVADGVETAAAMTPARVVCDTAANCTSVGPFGPFAIDRKAPSVRIDFPTENQSIPIGATVNADFSCADLYLTSCTSSIVGTRLPTSTPGSQSFTVTGTDSSGHTTSLTRNYVVSSTTLRGVVYGGFFGDDPLAGVLVEVWAWNAPRTGPPSATATTTPNGSWSIPNMVPNVPYYARYSRADHTTAWHGGKSTPETSSPIGGDVPISPVYTMRLFLSDTSGPTATCNLPPTSTWRTATVVFSCTASDPSGLASGTPASFSLAVVADPGTESSNASSTSLPLCDGLGNCSLAGPYTGFKYDRKAPTVTCPTPSTAWSAINLAYTCTTADAGIGAQYPSFSLTTSVGAGSSNASASTNAFTACDVLGNCAAPKQLTGLKVDRAAPAGTCATTPTTWQANNLTLTCTISDAGAGYAGASIVPAMTSVSVGQESAAATASTPLLCDVLNNCAPKTITGLKIDRKGPTVTCASPDGLWHNANVSLACTHSDGGAGLPATYDPFPPFIVNQPYPTGFSASTAAGTGTESASVAATATQKCDVLNNCTTVSITGNKIDRKAPTMASCPTPSTAWSATNVSVTCTAADGGSGLAQTSYTASTTVFPGASNAMATPVPVGVCDRVGNCANLGATGTWKVDRKAPSSSCAGAPATGAVIDDDIAITCSSADDGSGLDGSSPSSFALATAVGAGNEATVSTSSRQLCDAVQNCATVGPYGPFAIDRKAPVVAITSPVAGTYVALGSSLVADFACTDGFLDDCQGSTADGEELPGTLGSHTFTVTGTDRAGHATTVERTYTVLPADSTAPKVLCTPPTAAVATAWRSTQLTIPCTVTDASPLASPAQAAFTLSTDVPAGSETSAATIPAVEVCDVLGNCTSTTPYGPYKIDRKDPAVPCTNVPTDWIKTNAALVCRPGDGGSGSSTATFNLGTSVAVGAWDGDASTNAKTICDKVGNCTTVQSHHLKVDRAGPEVTCAAPPTTWNRDNVSVNCTVADPGAGYSGATTVRATTTLLAGLESANTPGRVVACDVLGTCTTKLVDGFKVDRKAPAWSCTQADELWHKENVTHACQQSDGGSGLTATSPAGGARDFTVATAVAPNNYLPKAVARGGISCDLVGNCATPSVPLNKIDRKAPTASCPAADTAWHGDNVTVTCKVADLGSGSPTSDLVLSTFIQPGAQSSTAPTAKGTFCDLAGNCVSMTAPGRYKVDRKAPKISVTAPTQGTARVVGSALTVAYTCTDDGAGVAGCDGPVPSGGTITATVLGPQTFSVEGVDAVGNRATTVVTWRTSEAVSGRVLDPSGNGIAGATVSRYAATGTGPAIDSVTTDADGRFGFVVIEPGSYRFGATKPGEYLPRFFGGSTLAGAPATSVDGITPRVLTSVTLTPASSIGGKVTSSATGEGLQDVEVFVYDGVGTASPVVAQTVTAADGTWRVAGLPAATYRYRMVAPGHVSEWHLDAATKAASTGVVTAAGDRIADLLDELAAAP